MNPMFLPSNPAVRPRDQDKEEDAANPVTLSITKDRVSLAPGHASKRESLHTQNCTLP